MSYKNALAHLRMLGFTPIMFGENTTSIRQSKNIIFKRHIDEILYYNLTKGKWRTYSKNLNTLVGELNGIQTRSSSS